MGITSSEPFEGYSDLPQHHHQPCSLSLYNCILLLVSAQQTTFAKEVKVSLDKYIDHSLWRHVTDLGICI